MSDTAQEPMLALERQRILADLHDGLGASLIGLLHHVQSGRADRASIELRIREALQEMRIAIDAWWPHGDRLETILGNLRFRLDDTLRDAGMQLQWDVQELPPVGALDPSCVFSIQRIVLEAVANSLKHSGARRLAITARALGDTGLEICVAAEPVRRGVSPRVLARHPSRTASFSSRHAHLILGTLRPRLPCSGGRPLTLAQRHNLWLLSFR